MDSPFFVAGERLVLSGKIQIPIFPAENINLKWEARSFSCHKNTSQPMRILKSFATELHDQKIKTFLSGISLITEIALD
jgi:hypothetical protein